MAGVWCSSEGHLFCKECIYEYLLLQKQEYEKEKELYEEQQRRLIEQEELHELKTKERELEKFDKTVLGISGIAETSLLQDRPKDSSKQISSALKDSKSEVTKKMNKSERFFLQISLLLLLFLLDLWY